MPVIYVLAGVNGVLVEKDFEIAAGIVFVPSLDLALEGGDPAFGVTRFAREIVLARVAEEDFVGHGVQP